MEELENFRERRFGDEPTLEEKLRLKIADFIPVIGLVNFFYRYCKIKEPISYPAKVANNTLIMLAYHAAAISVPFFLD
ncbi:hypothetical protein HYV49_00295 [Candidatus Pacearchaeota archaeon]|nr:hypothetical protein [Candidatus Pacearchaeota archaeon]